MSPTPDEDEVGRLRAIVGRPPPPSSPGARSSMRGNVRKGTGPERAVRSALHHLGLRFRVDFPIQTPGGRPIRPDIVFTRRRVAVFVDGCFWHGCPDHGTRPSANSEYWKAKIALNQHRDRTQAQRLGDTGWLVLRFWEHELPASVAERVASEVRAR